MEKKGILLFDTHEKLFCALSDEACGKLIKGIFEYEKSGEIPKLSPTVHMAFLAIQTSLDQNTENYKEICKKRSEAGKKSVLARKRKKALSENESETNLTSVDFVKQNSTNSTKNKDKDKNKDKNKNISLKERESTPAHAHDEEKKTYGEFSNVYLTDEEYEKLTKEYTNDTTLKAVNLLSTRIARDKNSKYKDENHYATIKDWVITAVMEQNGKNSSPGTSQKQSSSLDGYSLEDFFETP